jgi:hypothetical protein
VERKGKGGWNKQPGRGRCCMDDLFQPVMRPPTFLQYLALELELSTNSMASRFRPSDPDVSSVHSTMIHGFHFAFSSSSSSTTIIILMV